MKTGTWLLGAAFFFALASAHAQNISDNDFRQWSFGAYGVGGVATASVVPPKGASPRRLKVSTLTLPGDSAFATAIKGDFVTSAALAGARFTMTLGVLGGDGAFGAGQAIALLLEQAGSLYALPVGETKVESSHAMLPFSGTLVAERFTRVAGGGPVQPVLDGSAATRFGFAAGNSDSLAQTQYYDSFALDLVAPRAAGKAAALATVESVPALSDVALALLSALMAAAGFAAMRRSPARSKRR